MYGDKMLPSQRKAAMDIMGCMTAEMGGNRHRCNDCDETFWAYHGCRNRCCPKCHGRQMAEWLQKRSVEMLPCPYFHVVMTVPSELRALFLANQKDLYGILMKTTAHALISIAKESRYIGGEPAILSVLHTWTRQLHHHPHVHMLVSGGGLDEDGKTWREADPSFLVPRKKLSPLFRKKFREEIEKKRPDLLAQIPDRTWKKEWGSFIDCKSSSAGQDAVLNYLTRYAYRIAITSSRVLHMNETDVVFRYKENSTGLWKKESITGIEFIRRYLLHVLPQGFHKIRYFGLWSPAKRKHLRNLTLALKLLLNTEPQSMGDLAQKALEKSELENHGYVPTCPRCGSTNTSQLEKRRRQWRDYVT
jgi:hypothetical protein